MKRTRILIFMSLILAAVMTLSSCAKISELIGKGLQDLLIPGETETTDAGSGEGTTAKRQPREKDPLPVAGDLIPLEKTDCYGYRYLQSLDKPAYLWLYETIADGVEEMEEEISVEHDEYSFTAEELAAVFSCYSADYPEHFWRDNSYTFMKHGETGAILSVIPKYFIAPEKLDEMCREFNAAAAKMLEGIDALPSDYERELKIHDRIVENAHYDNTLSADMTHTAYSNLVRKTSVCDGYTKLFQYLLARCGILSFPVSGRAGDENHAWNVILLEEKYYFVDVTWDDPVGANETLSHEYFNCTTETFSFDHTPGADVVYPIPACTSDERNYYTMLGAKTEMTIDGIADVIADLVADGHATDKEFEMYLLTPTTQTAFGEFINTNSEAFFSKMTDALGADPTGGVSYSVSSSGRILTITFKF